MDSSSEHQGAADVEAGLGCQEDKASPAEGKLRGAGAVAAPSRAVTVTFARVTYSVKARRRVLTIVQDVSGALLPGTLTAILGPSGSGKTTLLDILAGRKTAGALAAGAEVLYNGRNAAAAYLRASVGYVEQHDTLLSMLTPYEMLLYTAELKHTRRQSGAGKRARVAGLVHRLGLGDCRDTVIGPPSQRGVSGGEAKRCNIGISLITDPAVLFLDEVSSGLDSHTANEVVGVVKELAAGGITVAATIHSPPPYTFALFDRAMVLQRGRVVYWGPNGDPAFDYLARTIPQLRPPRALEGLADYLIELTSAGDKGRAGAEIAEAYARSQLKARNDKEIQDLVDQARRQQAQEADAQAHEPPPRGCRPLWRPACGGGPAVPWWWSLLTLWRFRSLRAFKRLNYILPRVMTIAMAVFILATLYWGIGDDAGAGSVTSIAAVLFMWTVSAAFGTMGLLHILVLERPVYLRERSDGIYSPAIYLAYKLSEEFVVAFVVSVPACLLTFYLVHLQGDFILFWAVYLASISISIALALLAGAVSSNVDTAGALLPSYSTSLLYFAGFLIPFHKIPPYWQWFSVVDHIRYGWGALMVNQFGGERDVVAYGPLRVLEYYSLEGANKWGWLGYQLIFFAVFVLMTWTALTFIKHQRR